MLVYQDLSPRMSRRRTRRRKRTVFSRMTFRRPRHRRGTTSAPCTRLVFRRKLGPGWACSSATAATSDTRRSSARRGRRCWYLTRSGAATTSMSSAVLCVTTRTCHLSVSSVVWSGGGGKADTCSAKRSSWEWPVSNSRYMHVLAVLCVDTTEVDEKDCV